MPSKYIREKSNSLNLMGYLNIGVFFLFAAVAMTPYLTRHIAPTAMILLLIVWTLTAIISKLRYFIFPKSLIIKVFFWLLVLIFEQVIGFADDAVGNLLSYLSFWFAIIMWDFYSKSLPLKALNVIKWFLVILFSFNMVWNIVELYLDPNLAKFMTGAIEYIENFESSNAATFLMSLISSVFIIAALRLFSETAAKWTRLLIVLFILLNYVLLVLLSSAIGLISAIIMTVLYIYLSPMKRSSSKNMPFIIIILLAAFLVALFSQNILDGINNFINGMDNRQLALRLRTVTRLIFGGDVQGSSFAARVELYGDSLNTFINNLILGVGRRHTDVAGVISLHSQILDDLAYFGLFGLVSVVVILVDFYRTHLKLYVKELPRGKAAVLAFAAGTLFFAFFNPLFSNATGIAIFIFFPLCLKTAYERDSVRQAERADG